MRKIFTLSLVATVFCSSLALAERVAVAKSAVGYYGGASSGCMTENAQISISFNGVETDVALVKTKFDGKMVELEKLLKEAGLEKFEMQSMNYNISPQNYGGGMNSMFQYNGSLSYTVLPSDKATSLMAELTKKGFQTSVNVSAYRNGGVPCPETGTDKK